MLELQCALRHVVTLAPLLNTRDVVVDLQTALPGEEVPPHEQVVESRHSDQTKKLRHCLGDDAVL